MPSCLTCGASFSGAGSICPACLARGREVQRHRAGASTSSVQTLIRPARPPPEEPRAAEPEIRPRAVRTAETAYQTPPLEGGGRAPEAQRPAAGADPLIGQRPLGQYEIVRKIGEGGFGAVYLAEQSGIGRKAVIKVLRKQLVDSDIFVKRFEREAAVLAQLDNQHLVRLYNFGELDDGQLFLAMEYGGDATLADVIKSGGPLQPDRALLVLSQVCEALEEAHRHGIVHRDLKPQNILLSRKATQDWAKVVDVGIAKILEAEEAGGEQASLTRSGMIIGTPAYFSPEQARGFSIDARSDLYSAGVVLYEALSGSLPIAGMTPMDYVRAHAVEQPVPLRKRGVQVPPFVEQLVMKALEKEPAKRFQSAGEMAGALRAARERLYSDAGRGGRGRMVYVGIAVALAAVAAVVYAVARGKPPAAPVAAVAPSTDGALKLSGIPPAARVLVDGAAFDPGSPRLSAGPHRVRIENEGFQPLEQEISVPAGATVVLTVALQKEEPRAAPQPMKEQRAPSPPSAEVVRQKTHAPAREPPTAKAAPPVAPAPAAVSSRPEPAASSPPQAPPAAMVKPSSPPPAPAVGSAAPAATTVPPAAVPASATPGPRPCAPLIPAVISAGTLIHRRPDSTSDEIATLARSTSACAADSTQGFGFRRVRLPDGREGFVPDESVSLTRPPEAPRTKVASLPPVRPAATAPAPKRAEPMPCGALAPTAIRAGAEVHAGPDSTSRVLFTLREKTPACASTAPQGFGFRRVRLKSGSEGFVADVDLSN